MKDADFTFLDGGSVCLLTPVSPLGESWAGDNLPADAPTLGNGIAIERRYVPDILAGIEAGGLVVVRA